MAVRHHGRRAIADPLVLPDNSGFGGEPAVPQWTLDWQPGADEQAECLRAALETPVSRELVEKWLASIMRRLGHFLTSH
jgi:hypothetical protein